MGKNIDLGLLSCADVVTKCSADKDQSKGMSSVLSGEFFAASLRRLSSGGGLRWKRRRMALSEEIYFSFPTRNSVVSVENLKRLKVLKCGG